jgi:hypothetical protein
MVVFFLASNGNQINVQPLHHVCEVAFAPSLSIVLLQLCIVACFFLRAPTMEQALLCNLHCFYP